MRDRYVALIVVLCCFPAEAQEPVSVEIEMTKDAYGVGEEVGVKLTLENSDSNPWIVYPYIVPATCRFPNSPFPTLTFDLQNMQGESYTFVRECPEKARLPGPYEFLVMGPSVFFGRTISLTAGEFSHGIFPAGHYTIRASLHIEARSYFESRLESGTWQPVAMPYPLEMVYSGRIASNRLSFEIVER